MPHNPMLAGLNLPAPLSPLFRHRTFTLLIWGAATLQLILFSAGVPGWPCPVLHLFGVPCPGCGLTRAVAFLIQGDLKTSFSFHAFAPVFLGGIVVAGVAGVLPAKAREPVIDTVETLERRSGISVLILIGLILYWLLRLLLFPREFVQLMRG